MFSVGATSKIPSCDWLRLAARFRRMIKCLGSRGEMLFTVQVFWLGPELKQLTKHLGKMEKKRKVLRIA